MSLTTSTSFDAEKLWIALERISLEQRNICALLEELMILMRQPSEDVLRVLDHLLRPVNSSVSGLIENIKEIV